MNGMLARGRLAPAVLLLGALGCSEDPQAPLPGEDGGVPNGATDGGAVTPDLATPPTPAVLTYHNDNQRTGMQRAERILTPAALKSKGLRLAFTRPVTGPVHTQLLYVPNLPIAGAPHNVVYAATLRNWLYAYDADDASASGSEAGLVWKTQLVDPEDEAARPFHRGIEGTPVIDPAAGELYALFSTRSAVDEPPGESTVDVAFWLAAVDLTTGTLKRHVKVEATVKGPDGADVRFAPQDHRAKVALLLDRGTLYVGFGTRPREHLHAYHGWLMRYDQATLAPRGAFCVSPGITAPGNGGGLWGGHGPVADADGRVYLITGNGDYTPPRSYGNAFVKLLPEADALRVDGAWAPYDPMNLLQLNDVDLGSGGVVLLPGTRRLAGGGKTGVLYLLDADTMLARQEFQAYHNIYDPTFPVDSNWEGGPHLHGGPVAWQGPDPNLVYYYAWAENDYLRAYRYDRARDQFDTEPLVGSVLAVAHIMPAGMLTVSADGNQAGSGVVWAALPQLEEDPASGIYRGRLLAFDAETLELLVDTDFPSIPKWMPVTIADGKVLVPTSSNELDVFTLTP